MNSQPLIINSWPQAILHIDGDAFFASCEQSIHPEYRGRPLITGKERGIAAALSYEAKKRGVRRGMRIFEVKKLCPDCIILPSDYETYSLISRKMFNIIKKYSPCVEEYSIDEAFVDLTGLKRPLNMSYEKIAGEIKRNIEKSLDISVSVGLSLNKSLAKLASNYRKPSGITIVPGSYVHLLLAKVSLIDIWGIGINTASYLQKLGLRTALDLAQKNEDFVKKKLTKPGVEIWKELLGEYIYHVDPNEKDTYKSISKVKTFTPASSDRDFIYAQLIRNLENACLKMRRYNLAASKLFIFLKTQSYESFGVEIKLNRATSYEMEIAPNIKSVFYKIFNEKLSYRQTGIVLVDLREDNRIQYSLFDDPVRVEKIKAISQSINELDRTFGKHSVFLGSTLPIQKFSQHLGSRGDISQRKQTLMKGENIRQRLNLPYLFTQI
ncbi:DNA polymerase IV [Candidatus Roizmanbacteria bacterium RIFCSPHIGHO2_02_FULL_37_13b]|uniref:DNA polymerase IV n=1 Tax=Candidatus Roizmanbacteria bacterium RIFCSPLOWO2_02_FULL_36_11 TaxID=1802071 RepID=A0A1F7JGN8_9BACT|nr:MAG: DNA polymerase IV [Candidatus Roizmanbacteria bacterium RIFCSPHIGHO2_02_FULL_37_13b]OGK54780.1 MAG: DNA polymerase IV [Candidatus Roizmanbacteria bacterium RIFCSPLOWO2_02_FULL_36_11]